jgi:predicted CopG family antitoxin
MSESISTIRVKLDTKTKLRKLGKMGQSFDDLLSELIAGRSS